MNSEQWVFFTSEAGIILAGCLIAGIIPWLLKEMSTIPRKHLNRVNLFGAGILAGVCMVMIIPEGAEQLFGIENEDLLNGIEPCQYVGLCLVCGFILNLLCDKISHMFARSKEGAGLAVAIGMCIHGASDGVVMVASNWGGDSAVKFMVFFGMFVHKLPASFGVATSVIHQPDVKNKWYALLIIVSFALSCPIGGYITLMIFEASGVPYEDTKETIVPGILLLISAGTVLYVAMCHIIPEAFGLECDIMNCEGLPYCGVPEQSNGVLNSVESLDTGTGVDVPVDVDRIEAQKAALERKPMNIVSDSIDIGIVILGLCIPVILVFALPEEE